MTRFDRVLRAVDEAVVRHQVPRAVVGVWSDGKERVAATGRAEADDRFKIGSITKSFTGTAALRLAQAGKLAFDERVSRHLGRLPVADSDVAARVTMRHLLTHTAGWLDDAPHAQIAPLGALWSYCNSCYSLAGDVIGAVASKPYAEAVHELVLAPLGVAATFDDELEPALRPAGGLSTSVPMLLRYGRAHLEDPGLQSLREPAASTGNPDEWIGLGWFLKDRRKVRFAEHGGHRDGAHSWLAIAPDHEFALALATYAPGGVGVIAAAHETAFAEYLGVGPWRPDSYEPSPEELRLAAGVYAIPGHEVELRVDSGRLVLTTGDPAEPRRESSAVVEESARPADHERRRRGRVAALQAARAPPTRLERCHEPAELVAALFEVAELVVARAGG